MSLFRCFWQTLKECCTNLACAPFFMLAIVFYAMYYCWPYMAQLPEHISTAIVDEDNSPLSRRLVQALRASPNLDVLQVTANREEAIGHMQAQNIVTIVGIPPDFEKDALSGTPTAMTLVTNGAFIVKSRSSVAGASGPLREASMAAISAELVNNGMSPSMLKLSAMRAPGLIIQPMFNNISGYLNFVVPIVFIIIIQTLMLCGTGMLFNDWYSQREQPEVLMNALCSPIYLLAVQGPVFLISFLWTLICEGDIFALHGVNSFQNVPATFAMAAAFALAVSSLAILVGLLLGPTNFVIQAVVITSLPCVFISGNLWPAHNIPIYIRALAWLLPSTPGSCGMMRASQCGATVHEILPYAAHLIILGFAYMAMAFIICHIRKSLVQHVNTGGPSAIWKKDRI